VSLRAARLAPEKADFRPALPLRSLPGLNGTDMPKMAYAEQLKHPNWQKKRLESLQAAGWKCQRCEAKDETLHVHHKKYFKGRMAWEYSLHELAVLCESCHSSVHDDEDFLARVMLASGHIDMNLEAGAFYAGLIAAHNKLDGEIAGEARAVHKNAFDLGCLAGSLGIERCLSAARSANFSNPSTWLLDLLAERNGTEE
jgi:hypothetical protein